MKRQETGDRGQGSGVRGQGSGVWGQVSGQGTGTRSQDPGFRPQEPGALGHKAPLMVACGDTVTEAGLFGTFHLHSQHSQGLPRLAFPQAIPCLW